MQLVGEHRIHFLDFVLVCCWVLMFSLVISLVRSAESEEIYMSPRELFSDGAFYILWFISLLSDLLRVRKYPCHLENSSVMEHFTSSGSFSCLMGKGSILYLHCTRWVYHFFTIQG